MPRQLLNQATRWITEEALRHPADLAPRVAALLGVGRPAVQRLLRRLEQAQWLQRMGTARRPHDRPGALRQVVRRYLLDGLDEAWPWQRDFAPAFDLPAPLARMAQHLFGELLNNAIEHSGGSCVTVSMRQTPTQLQLLVSDDGRGVFDAIAEHFDLADPALAMLELAKGKLTTQPDRHSGRGLFFCAKLADIFDLHANDAAFQQRAWLPDQWFTSKPACRRGSSVYAAIGLDSERTLDAVLRHYSRDGAGYGFDRTVVPLKLITQPHTGLESRAQARRVAARLTQFQRVELDFTGLADVGHGFVDELFRVWRRDHAQLELEPVNMAPRVAALVDSVRAPLPA